MANASITGMKHCSCMPLGSSTFDKHCESYDSIAQAVAALDLTFETCGLQGIPAELTDISFLSAALEETGRPDLRASIRAAAVAIHRREVSGELSASEARCVLAEQIGEILEQRKIARRAMIEKTKGMVGEK